MRFRQIEAFRATMLSGTITGAAKQLSITQPSASRLIADLENSLQFSLFERAKGRLLPTPEAVQFYQEVVRSFAGLDKLERAAAQIREERTGHLLVHASPALSSGLLPAALKQFMKTWPNVVVTVEVRSPAAIFEVLQMQSTDIAISNEFAELPGIEQETLITTNLVCALPPGHRLTTYDIIKPKDLQDENFIGLSPEGPLNWNIIDSILKTADVSVNMRMTSQRAHAVYAMVAEGLGLALVEPFSAPTWMRHGVVVKPFRPKIPYSFALCFPRHKVRSQLARELRFAVKQELAENPPLFCSEADLG